MLSISIGVGGSVYRWLFIIINVKRRFDGLSLSLSMSLFPVIDIVSFVSCFIPWSVPGDLLFVVISSRDSNWDLLIQIAW